MDHFHEKGPTAYLLKMPEVLIAINFRTGNAIDFLFLTLHTTLFLYVNYILVTFTSSMLMLRDPTNQGVFQNLECTSRTIDLFCSLIFTLSATDSCAKLIHISSSFHAINACNARSILPIHNKK